MKKDNLKMLQLATDLAHAEGELGTLTWSHKTSDELADELADEILSLVNKVFLKSVRKSDPAITIMLEKWNNAISDLSYFYEVYEPSNEYEDDEDSDPDVIKAKEQFEWLGTVSEFIQDLHDGYNGISDLDIIESVFSLVASNAAFEAIEDFDEESSYVTNLVEAINNIVEFSKKYTLDQEDPMYLFLAEKCAESISTLSVYAESDSVTDEDRIAINTVSLPI